MTIHTGADLNLYSWGSCRCRSWVHFQDRYEDSGSTSKFKRKPWVYPRPTWKSWIWLKIQLLVWVRPPQLKILGPPLIHTILIMSVCYLLGTKEFILNEGREPVRTISAPSGFFSWADPSVGMWVQSHLGDSRNAYDKISKLKAFCFTAFVYCFHIHPCPKKKGILGGRLWYAKWSSIYG